MTPEDELATKAELNDALNDVDLGDRITEFIKSPIGRFIEKNIEQSRTDTLEALATVDPKDEKAITGLQNKIFVYDKFWQTLMEGVHRGDQAQRQLDSLE